jgi:hypothetical protein
LKFTLVFYRIFPKKIKNVKNQNFKIENFQNFDFSNLIFENSPNFKLVPKGRSHGGKKHSQGAFRIVLRKSEKTAPFGSAFAFFKQKQVQKAEPNTP